MASIDRSIAEIDHLVRHAQIPLPNIQREYVGRLFDGIAATIQNRGPRGYLEITRDYYPQQELSTEARLIGGVEFSVTNGKKITSFAFDASQQKIHDRFFVSIQLSCRDGDKDSPWRPAGQYLLSDGAVRLRPEVEDAFADDAGRMAKKIHEAARAKVKNTEYVRAMRAVAWARLRQRAPMRRAKMVAEWRGNVAAFGKFVLAKVTRPGLPRFTFRGRTSGRHLRPSV